MGLAGGLSIDRDQTSAEDKALNKQYREGREGETFTQANQNQANASRLKFGLGENDVHSADKYAIAKIGLANALSNSKESESQSSITKSSISDGVFTVQSEQGKRNIQGIQKSNVEQTNRLEKIDQHKLQSNVENNVATIQEFTKNVAGFTDEAYRTMFIAEHRMMTFVTDENGVPIKDEARLQELERLAKEKYREEKKNLNFKKSEEIFVSEYMEDNPLGINIYKLREVSDQERQHLNKVSYFDPKTKSYKSDIAVMFNGILNDRQAAAKYAVQNYIAEKDNNPIYKNIYFVHNPQANNIVSELLVAGYQKYTEGNIGDLANSTIQARNIMEQYGKGGLYLGSHSRGTLTVDNALNILDKSENKGLLSNTRIKMVGPAANVNEANSRFMRLQGDKPTESVRFENNKLDTVGSLIGSNPYTNQTNTKEFGDMKRIYDLLLGDTSAHNCYGIGNLQCIKDGYRENNEMKLEVPFIEIKKSQNNKE